MTMETSRRKFLFLALFFATQAYGQDVSDILNQIDSEKETKKQANVNSTAIQPVTAPAPSGKVQQEKAKQKSPIKQTEKPSKNPTASESRIVVYRPKDNLPKNVTGSGVAGDFLITGEDALGGATIIAAEDALNPFARIFIIKNASSGHPPGTVLPIESRRSITISSENPLLFIGRGMIPGEYQVRAQENK